MIGAGAAGLAAAAELLEGGRSVHVVEARARTGGRIHTIRPSEAGGPVELGAEFVHGAAPRTHRLLREAGAGVVPMSGAAWRAEHGRVAVGDEFWEAVERVLGGLDAARVPDRSFAEHLRARRDAIASADAEAARSFVEGFYAADPERVSERALADEGTEGASDSSRIPEGYDRLIERLERRVGAGRITLGRAVRRVVWERGRVELETVGAEDGAAPQLLGARAVVVTVPLGVLVNPDGRGSLRFDPEIGDVHGALERLAMGSVVRATLAFTRPPWDEPRLLPTPVGAEAEPSFLVTPSERFTAFWRSVDGGGLVAWSGGTRSRSLPGDPAALRSLSVAALAHATGADANRLGAAVRDVWTHAWQTDPWSCGAYAYIQVGGADAPSRLARPVEDTIFFAGEATSADLMGTVEGALASAERAARAVLGAFV